MPSFNNRFEPATITGIPLYAAISCLFAVIFLALSILSYTLSIVGCVLLGICCFVSIVVAVYFFRMDDEVIFQRDIFDAFMESNLVTSDIDKADRI